MTLNLTALRELLEKATPGPWRAAIPKRPYHDGEYANSADLYPRTDEDRHEIACLPHHIYDALDIFSPPRSQSEAEHIANARLIATLRNNAPALLDAYEQRERLVAALEGLESKAFQYLKAAEDEFGDVESDGSSSQAELELNAAVRVARQALSSTSPSRVGELEEALTAIERLTWRECSPKETDEQCQAKAIVGIRRLASDALNQEQRS